MTVSVLLDQPNQSRTFLYTLQYFSTPYMDDTQVLRGVYSDTTQLNSTDPVEQRTAKLVVFLFVTSRPTD